MRTLVFVCLLFVWSCGPQGPDRDPPSPPEPIRAPSVWKKQTVAGDRLQEGWKEEFSLAPGNRSYTITTGTNEDGTRKISIDIRDKESGKNLHVFLSGNFYAWVPPGEGTGASDRYMGVRFLAEMLDKHVSGLPSDVQEWTRRASELVMAEVDSASRR